MDKLTDIGCRGIFNDEHDTLRENVRKFYSGVDQNRKVKWEEQGFVDRDFWLEGCVRILKKYDKICHFDKDSQNRK